jgi:phosphoserine phosphatase
MTAAAKQTSGTATEAECNDVIRSIRFRKDHFAAIMKVVKKKNLDFSSFVRQAALRAAGVGKAEVSRLEKQVKSLASIGDDVDPDE